MELSVTNEAEGHFTVFCPAKMEWDARTDLLAALESATAGREFRSAIIDFKNVTYINSAGLGAVFKLLEHARKAGAKVVLSRPNPTIARLLETVNLPALAAVAGSLQEARGMAGIAAEPPWE